MRIALGIAAILMLGGGLGGCTAVDAVGTVAGAATTAVGTAVDVGSTVVGTAADTVGGSSDEKSDE